MKKTKAMFSGQNMNMLLMMMIIIIFAVWLTNKRHLALLPARTIVRDSHHRESLTCSKQDLNLHGTWITQQPTWLQHLWYSISQQIYRWWYISFWGCRSGVGSNFIFCSGCKHWVHKKCNIIRGRQIENINLRCARCSGLARPINESLCNSIALGVQTLEVVDLICYLDDITNAGCYCSCGAIVGARSAWGKIRELLPLLTNRYSKLKLEETFSIYVCDLFYFMVVIVGHWKKRIKCDLKGMTRQS